MECSEHVCPAKAAGICMGWCKCQVLFLTVHSGEWHWGNWSLLNVHWPGLQEAIQANGSLCWRFLPHLHCNSSATQLMISQLTSLLCPQPLQGHLSLTTRAVPALMATCSRCVLSSVLNSAGFPEHEQQPPEALSALEISGCILSGCCYHAVPLHVTSVV